MAIGGKAWEAAGHMKRNQPLATLSRWILSHSSADGGSC